MYYKGTQSITKEHRSYDLNTIIELIHQYENTIFGFIPSLTHTKFKRKKLFNSSLPDSWKMQIQPLKRPMSKFMRLLDKRWIRLIDSTSLNSIHHTPYCINKYCMTLIRLIQWMVLYYRFLILKYVLDLYICWADSFNKRQSKTHILDETDVPL